MGAEIESCRLTVRDREGLGERQSRSRRMTYISAMTSSTQRCLSMLIIVTTDSMITKNAWVSVNVHVFDNKQCSYSVQHTRRRQNRHSYLPKAVRRM
jgi:hypothetical protein